MKLAESAIRAGYRLNAFEVLGSTSDEAMRRAVAGDRGRLWVVAARQTGGRGRHGRSWSSPPGNVYASLLLVDACPQSTAPQLGLVAGVALYDALRDCLGGLSSFAIKWPNDIVHGGAKLAGILVEGARCPDGRFACVLGLGVNRISSPEGLAYPTTNLSRLVHGEAPSLDSVVAALSAAMDNALGLWDRGRGFAKIRERWLDRALPPGTSMSVSTPTTRANGRFGTIDEQGRLVLATETGEVTVEAGDVFLMDQHASPAEKVI